MPSDFLGQSLINLTTFTSSFGCTIFKIVLFLEKLSDKSFGMLIEASFSGMLGIRKIVLYTQTLTQFAVLGILLPIIK